MGVSQPSRNAADAVQRIVRALIKHELEPTPFNYHVWYNHLAGMDPDLSRAIEAIVNAKKHLTDEDCRDLYHTYIVAKSGHDHLRRVHEEMQRVLKDTLGSVACANTATAAFGDVLDASGASLGTAPDLDAVRSIVRTLATKTVAMATTARSVREELEAATREIEGLESRLVETERAVLRDPLTGLFNRTGTDRRLNELQSSYRASGATFSVVLADIDHFKRFNDTFGHQVGDAVLRQVGKVLKDSLKGKDFVARYGGEEFIALLPETGRDGASIVADQIRATIQSQRLKVVRTAQSIPSITMSLGVAEFASADTGETVVERADQALYLAKRSGRNAVKTEAELAKSA